MENRQDTLRFLRQNVCLELETNLAPFWLKHAKYDGEKGFTGRMSNDLVKQAAAKGLVLHARLLWTFSALYRFKSDLKYLHLARQMYEYIYNCFFDRQFGGAYWLLTADGDPDDTAKKTYGQAFLIYALSEFYKCHPTPLIREQAVDIFSKLEQHALDSANGGYYEVCRRDWTLAVDQRLSDRDMDEKKSMNTHLHVLEAFTNLYSIWPEQLVRQRLVMLLDMFRDKIIQPDGHLGLFFDESWNVRSRGVSFGHEIEASWLMLEAAEALNDIERLLQYERIAESLAAGVYADGLDESGGVHYEIDEQGKLDTDKHFWSQAEAVVGFLNAWQLTSQEDYLSAAVSAWDFIQKHLVDRRFGEWYWKVDAVGIPDYDAPKISIWKCPYHNIRACMEIIKRIDALTFQRESKGSYVYE